MLKSQHWSADMVFEMYFVPTANYQHKVRIFLASQLFSSNWGFGLSVPAQYFDKFYLIANIYEAVKDALLLYVNWPPLTAGK